MTFKPRFWTQHRINTAIEMHSQGISFVKIAEGIGDGCTKHMVYSLARYHRKLFPLREIRAKPTPEMIMPLWKNNMPISAIAEKTGFTLHQVKTVVKNNRDMLGEKKQHRFVAPREPVPDFKTPLDDFEAQRLPYTKPLWELVAKECHFPIGDETPHKFCACQITQNSRYCQHHTSKAAGVAKAA